MPLLLAAAVVLMLTGWPWQRHSIAEHNHNGKEAWVAAFKQTHDVSLADTLSGYSIYPDPERTGLARKLEWLRKNRYSLFRGNSAQPE
jgi:ribosomal 30S subunit maturation factor RimM